MSIKLSHPHGMGWLRDLPSFRDYTPENAKVKPLLSRVKALQGPVELPAVVDLRAWCSPIENQGALGSCTANAAAGLYEYFEQRTFGVYTDVSRLFLYKVERDLLHWTGDTGAYLRTAMEALSQFGAPPEEYWPYDVSRFEVEPSAFCYAFAADFKALNYFRFDPPGTNRTLLLNTIKQYLAAGFASMFGFTVYQSYGQAATNGGKFPFPTAREQVVGGHAIVAVGYDDTIQIRNSLPGATPTTGAFLIRNSWGTGWGANGYGYLPYEYVLRGIATDWWTIVKESYINTAPFK